MKVSRKFHNKLKIYQNNRIVDKLKKNDFLYGILIIPITEGHFYDGKAKRTNPDANP